VALCLHSVILYGMVLYLNTRKSLSCVCVFFVSDVIVAPLVSRFVVGGGSVIRVETQCHMGAGRDDRTSVGYTVYSASKDNPLAGLRSGIS
jgi:hypothetical protein